MKKVALDVSILESQSATRGMGVYTKGLLSGLGALEDDVLVEPIDFIKDKDRLGDFDLFHYPYFDPFFLTLPLFKKKPTVVTVHDLIPILFSRYFPPGVRGKIKWQIQKQALLSCRAIVTDSDCSKKDIARITGFAKDNIFRIYLAPGNVFKPGKKYFSQKPYFLYVGDVNWNKNVFGLVKAFKSQANRQNYLLLVGKAFAGNSQEAIEIRRLAAGDPRIKFLGFVPDSLLASLYAGAICLVQPSFYEGFGLPVLEAMSCGCPVVASRVSSLPEVAGEAAYYIDPYKSGELEKALETMSVGQLRNRLIKRGFSQAAKFSWEKTARETYKVYRACL